MNENVFYLKKVNLTDGNRDENVELQQMTTHLTFTDRFSDGSTAIHLSLSLPLPPPVSLPISLPISLPLSLPLSPSLSPSPSHPLSLTRST